MSPANQAVKSSCDPRPAGTVDVSSDALFLPPFQGEDGEDGLNGIDGEQVPEPQMTGSRVYPVAMVTP